MTASKKTVIVESGTDSAPDAALGEGDESLHVTYRGIEFQVQREVFEDVRTILALRALERGNRSPDKATHAMLYLLDLFLGDRLSEVLDELEDPETGRTSPEEGVHLINAVLDALAPN